jgi:TetR/AcrR family transcriptional repressor of nem operon
MWSRGFESSSLDDLTAATGLNKSSFYNTFGSKRQLLGSALDLYDRMLAIPLEPVERGIAGLDDLLAYLDGIERASITDPRGCFMVNCTTELGLDDPEIARRAAAYRGRLRAAFARSLEIAARAGQIEGEVETRADLVLAAMMGIFVAVRAQGGQEDVHRMFAAVRQQVAAWRSLEGAR